MKILAVKSFLAPLETGYVALRVIVSFPAVIVVPLVPLVTVYVAPRAIISLPAFIVVIAYHETVGSPRLRCRRKTRNYRR